MLVFRLQNMRMSIRASCSHKYIDQVAGDVQILSHFSRLIWIYFYFIYFFPCVCVLIVIFPLLYINKPHIKVTPHTFFPLTLPD